MKKLISILLAVLMMFSLVTVAFAETEVTDIENTAVVDENVKEDGTEDGAIDLGEYDWILDLPFWTVGPAFKLAKIALKLVNVFLKVGKIFGLVDKDMGDYIMEAIIGMIKDAENGQQTEDTTEAPVETTQAPAVA